MRPIFRKNLISRLITLVVFIALITISIFQYNWVVSSAVTEISELYKSLTYSFTQQFQDVCKETPVINNRFNFLNNRTSEKEVLKEVGEFMAGNNPDYIRNLLYIQVIQNQILQWSNTHWVDADNSINEIKKILPKDNRHPPGELITIPDKRESNHIWIILPLLERRESFLLFQVDMEVYLSGIISNIEQKLVSDYDVTILQRIPESGNIMGRKEYRYSVFQRDKWFAEIPIDLEIFPQSTERIQRPGNLRPPKDLILQTIGTLFIDIQLDGLSLITIKENTLTIQWLGIFLLLMSVGAGYFFVVYQITGLKKLRLREREFIATVTHELRTPVTVIQSAANNLERGFLKTDRVKQYGSLINDQSTRLSSMIEGILLFSRLEGKVERTPIYHSVDFDSLYISLDVFSKSLMELSGHKIIINFDELPKSAITDRETIELILTNLISNSNKHAYKKGERGEIHITGYLIGDSRLQFIVEDFGVGMDSYDRKHIFEPFYRGKRSYRLQISGSGLGLYLSSKKAELLGGSLSVESEKGKGSKFILELEYEKSINN